MRSSLEATVRFLDGLAGAGPSRGCDVWVLSYPRTSRPSSRPADIAAGSPLQPEQTQSASQLDWQSHADSVESIVTICRDGEDVLTIEQRSFPGEKPAAGRTLYFDDIVVTTAQIFAPSTRETVSIRAISRDAIPGEVLVGPADFPLLAHQSWGTVLRDFTHFELSEDREVSLVRAEIPRRRSAIFRSLSIRVPRRLQGVDEVTFLGYTGAAEISYTIERKPREQDKGFVVTKLSPRTGRVQQIWTLQSVLDSPSEDVGIRSLFRSGIEVENYWSPRRRFKVSNMDMLSDRELTGLVRSKLRGFSWPERAKLRR